MRVAPVYPHAFPRNRSARAQLEALHLEQHADRLDMSGAANRTDTPSIAWV